MLEFNLAAVLVDNPSTSPKARVSIIIPAFNVEDMIGKCIESVLAQTSTEFEAIVIDDGSTDGTWTVIERYTALDKRLRALRQDNQGLSAARNNGMELAQGDLLLFLDSDDWIHPKTVADALEIFDDTQPDVVLMRCAKYFDGDGTWASGTDDFYWRLLESNKSRTGWFRNDPEILVIYPLAQLKILSKSFSLKHRLQFINGLKYEDNPFHIALYCLNPKYALLPKRYYAWLQGRSSQITAKAHTSDCLIVIRNMLKFVDQFSSKELSFLLIALTRLISGVAQRIKANSVRRRFIDESVQSIRNATDSRGLEAALGRVTAATNMHPADVLLVRSLFGAPHILNKVLDSGTGRYAASLLMLIFASRSGNFFSSIRSLVGFLSNLRMLINYSRGVGEIKVSGLG